jgi:hypothetical protein
LEAILRIKSSKYKVNLVKKKKRDTIESKTTRQQLFSWPSAPFCLFIKTLSPTGAST